MRIVALVGTESGRAEAVALVIARAEPSVEVMSMADAPVDVFERGELYLVACAPNVGAELPGFAQLLHDDLDDLSPDLTGVRYAMFGARRHLLRGVVQRWLKAVDALLARLGAERIGRFGEHDEISHQDHVALGVAWAREVLAGRHCGTGTGRRSSPTAKKTSMQVVLET